MASTQFALTSPPADAISAVKFSPYPNSTRLVVSSWDRYVYVYDLRDENGAVGEGKLLHKFKHRAPVLDVCFGENENVLYTAGLDWDVRRIDVPTATQTVLSTHRSGVKSVVYSKEHNLLISASWDSTIHIHRTANPANPSTQAESLPTISPATIPLPAKPFSVSLSPTKLVVAMGSRTVYIYDLHALSTFLDQSSNAGPETHTQSIEPWQRRESSLKFMTRAVACMSNDAGYASSSIEGRVAVEWFDPSDSSQDRKYAFKCHRQQTPDEPGVDVVYPVNALAFHPVHGTFASGGGDGVVALWDGVAKRRIRQYQRFPASVAALAFSSDGRYLAIGVCSGFEEGKEREQEDAAEGVVKVFIRELGESEAKGKGTK
ncbi:spindle assembly checkpoint protein SLDB [Histoplasma capsulatum G186AR]|uniref:Spindle assembly checkpoint protein SLDB n=2 Tax=Ajellomyces capsulatus TaxID=5037 RepID=C0NRR5_AJECG|nr:spindle assembly checkpoint protein SLDB [Histoplasma capsulatum G186AR]EEH05581.1 spindle assembly checkpoint protein SLDB [Histoplasma capsulatum G186AR]KAG5298750.1 spindle assembly checkpoint protein SLDB [Histoplasma capsulatum]QSS67093.1 spindle assembly checkpoint protein SLDB [Histoplasma capsulatum G186AR]